jgi:VCBS repeat-containing protein
VIDAAANVGNTDSQAVTIVTPSVTQDDALATTEDTIITANLFDDNGSGPDSDPDSPLSVTGWSSGTVGTQLTLPSGALLTVNADGTLSYDPNHVFDYLPTLGSGASNLSVTNTFTYTTTDGDTATVTVKVSGVDSNDVLLDSPGIDTLAGGNFNDLYYVNNTDDVVIEAANAGFDTVAAFVDYTLPASNTVEVLNMLGSGLTGTGSDGAETFISSNGPNTLVGLGGNDTYYVNNTADVVIEAANGGIDTVEATVNYTLPTGGNIEGLYMLGSGLTGTGSDGAETLLSSGGPNTLVGLGGNDLYYVNNAADVVIEAANGGYDIVVASVDYTPPANVEALYMSGTGLTGTGSASADCLLSSGGPNTLVGLGGDDLYYVNNAADIVTEAANGGFDSEWASVNRTLSANVEALYMNGSGLTGTGSSSADTLVTLGANTLIGGDGNDTFVFLAGRADGATVADFNRDQVSEWDFLVLSGFGTEAEGATISQIGSTDQWQIHSGLDAHNETIILSNHAALHAGDFVFV